MDDKATTAQAAAQVAEQAARTSYGRLVAWLAYRWRDLAAAEDALADAFHAALQTWPVQGVPAAPDAWLLTAAKRNLLQMARHARVRSDPAVLLLLEQDEVTEPLLMREQLPDDRLKLLFVCAHPAIDVKVRTPLMLQTVLGLDAARIASAFLVAPATMAQRLVRAKTKIRDSGLRFETPEHADLAERLHAVLEAIYAAYGTGWDDLDGLDTQRQDLSNEAIYLADLLASLMPHEPEALGLLALLLFCHSRQAARLTPDGAFAPLDQQDTAQWNRYLHRQAEQLLSRAAGLNNIGPFQIEAAIQSAHMQRLNSDSTPWPDIVRLYDWLVSREPTTGALLGQAAAVGRAEGWLQGWQLLQQLDEKDLHSHQPYWAVKAHLLSQSDQAQDQHEAVQAYSRAMGLSESVALRAHLQAMRSALQSKQSVT